LGLYYLDTADLYAQPSPQQVCERVQMILAAMGRLTERGGRRPLPPPAVRDDD
jgi:hypothetical protein